MKKTLLTLALASLLATPFALAEAVEDSVTGVTYELNEDGSFARLRSIGEAELEIGDAKDIRTAKIKAQMRGKAKIAQFLKEGISSEESMDNIEKMLTEANGQTKTVNRETVEDFVEKIKVNAEATLKGVVTLKTDVNKDNKTVLVEVGYSPRTQKVADEINNNLNTDLTGGKTSNGTAAGGLSGEQQGGREIRKAKNYDNF
ncbi:hypothetical protein [Lonepinella sp. BR2271]|uniref:hypothetical protein n=1 Tax=Lonepinella sp. BR2271 TaxID=3434550 RepID=UPI003F6DCFBF